MHIECIQESIAAGRVRVTDHADDEAADDRLTYDEIIETVAGGQTIEDYPDDWPYPSCLIHGELPDGDAVHSVWAYNARTDYAVLVTVYRPNPELWIDSRLRKDKT